MMKNIYYFIFACTVLIFASCNDDDTTNNNQNPVHVTDTEFAKNFGAEVQRDFIGQIVDKQNNAIAGATVKIGSSNVQTDVNGVFIINNADVYEKFAYITAAKPGFINGSRSLVPTSGKNNVKIMLLPATTTQTIIAGENSTVDLPNGTKIVFDGAFADENGVAYNGNVNVSMFHLEASDAHIGSLMPGMLYAKNDSGQPVGLETFGMLHAQLTGSAGQKLQIASGHTAQITMKIDNSQMATAPNSIPLWHFDEVNGYWKQEGEATKQGNNYEGNVSHFSWWNCDAPFEVILMGVHVKNEAGYGLHNVEVKLVSSMGSASAVTNINGEIKGLAPANKLFTVLVKDGCGNTVESFEAGPFNTTTQLQDIILSEDVVHTKIITGSLVKCDNNPVTNGYLKIASGTQQRFIPITDGDFSSQFLVCNSSNNFMMQGFDFDALQTTGEIFNQFTSASVQDVGDLKACSAIAEFISYDYDGNHYYLTDIGTYQHNNSSTYAYTIAGIGANARFWIYSNITTPGIYSESPFNIWVSVGNTTWDCNSYISSNFVSVQLNHCGVVGEYIDVSFSGSWIPNTGLSQHVISGIAHVKRRAQP